MKYHWSHALFGALLFICIIHNLPKCDGVRKSLHQSQVNKLQLLTSRSHYKTQQSFNREKKISDQSITDHIQAKNELLSSQSNRIDPATLQSSDTRISLYTRSSQGGIWIFYKDIVGNSSTTQYIKEIRTAMSYNQSDRNSQITSYLSKLVLGDNLGMAIPLIYNDIVTTVKAMKKVRLKHVEVGYALHEDDRLLEEIDSDDRYEDEDESSRTIFTLTKSGRSQTSTTTNLDKPYQDVDIMDREKLYSLQQPLQDSIRSAQINKDKFPPRWIMLENYILRSKSIKSRPGIERLIQRVDLFCKELLAQKQHLKITIATDGSAVIDNSASRSSRMITAAGAFVTSYYGERKIMTEQRFPSSNLTNTSGNGKNSSALRFLPNRSLGDWKYPLFSEKSSIAVNIKSNEGWVHTPSESEILAGIIGLTVAKLIVDRYNSIEVNQGDGVTETLKDHRNSSLDIKLLSDSKTLVRIWRMNKQSPFFTTSTEKSVQQFRCEEEDEDDSLLRKPVHFFADLQRLLSFDCINQYVERCDYQWIAGHPERKENYPYDM